MEDGEELKTFIKVWFFAILSICYCYLIPIRINNGLPRLLSILPVIILLIIAPLQLSTFHIAFFTFIYLTWLANFKLLLYAFNLGPLASTPSLTFPVFISTALFPINRKQTIKEARAGAPVPSHKPTVLAFKALILIVVNGVASHYKDKLNEDVILLSYFCYMYFAIELVYAITALFVKIFTGFKFEIEPQFDEPHLATSLQDFWGRRWNLMASGILRPIVYNPVRNVTTPVLGKLRGQMSAIFVTFVVSGLMHELMYLYLTRVRPTWEVTWFFILHGVCTALEVAVKKAVNDRFCLHWVVSGPLTMMFVVVTGSWLLFPQLVRNEMDVKIMNECSILVNFVKSTMEMISCHV